MTRYIIDPAQFTESQWEALYEASTLVPRAYETRDKTHQFQRGKKEILLAVAVCRNCAQNVRQIQHDEAWAQNLLGAAEVLETALGPKRVSRAKASRTHYIVRLSKLALIPGRILTFTRGNEVPSSITEIRTEDAGEAARIASEHMQFDGELTKVTKVYRSGRREEISNGFNNGGFLSPEDREVLTVDGAHCRCRWCGWSFTVHISKELMEFGAYGPGTVWFCPNCGK